MRDSCDLFEVVVRRWSSSSVNRLQSITHARIIRPSRLIFEESAYAFDVLFRVSRASSMAPLNG
jgi:hypothetical protein